MKEETVSLEYLSPADVAAELRLSRSRAYEIVRECTRIVAGRTIRVSRESFEAWKRGHEQEPQRRAEASAMRQAARAWKPQRLPKAAISSEENPFFRPIVPRTGPGKYGDRPHDDAAGDCADPPRIGRARRGRS